MYGSKKFVPSVVVGLRVQRTATTFVIRRYLRKSFEGIDTEVLSKVLPKVYVLPQLYFSEIDTEVREYLFSKVLPYFHM